LAAIIFPIPRPGDAVSLAMGKKPKSAAFEGSTAGEGVVYFDSFDKSAAGAVRAAFAT
jgi:hypothetical protein